MPDEHPIHERKVFYPYVMIKGPVKLIKLVKIAHSFLQSVSNQFHVIILSRDFKHAYVILQMVVKEFSETHF